LNTLDKFGHIFIRLDNDIVALRGIVAEIDCRKQLKSSPLAVYSELKRVLDCILGAKIPTLLDSKIDERTLLRSQLNFHARSLGSSNFTVNRLLTSIPG
jgi:hypothetical protein